MMSAEIVSSVADQEEDGRYHFDLIALNGPLDILGTFQGDMSGLILAESSQEREERMKRMVVLPELASPTRIAL